MNAEYTYEIKDKSRFVYNTIIDRYIGVLVGSPIFSLFIIIAVNLYKGENDNVFLFNLVYITMICLSELFIIFLYVRKINLEFSQTRISLTENAISSNIKNIKLDEIKYAKRTNNGFEIVEITSRIFRTYDPHTEHFSCYVS